MLSSMQEQTTMRAGVTDEVAISFKNVIKQYKLYRNDRARFLGAFSNAVKHKTVNASNNLNFEIKHGESVAFLGLNGAGKSTILKMITGVTNPTSGEVQVNGNVSALLELRAGFDSQLTGRENVRLRGHIAGMTDEAIEAMIPAIEEFAELGQYFDQPLRTYSSGMKSRLGFAFASSVDPDIFLCDEALSVGDKRFKRKCLKRVREIMTAQGVTVVFVTHDMKAAKEFCQRGIVLERGTVVFDGPIDQALEYYDAHL